jgi:phosphate starvation-inducible membrane PsiE
MQIVVNIIMSIFAYGVTSLMVAFMLDAPSQGKLPPKLEEILQYFVFYSIVAFELYIIWA